MLRLLRYQRPLCLEEEVASKEGDTDDNVGNDDGDKDMPPKA